MSDYQCEKCGAPATVGHEGVVRSCDCGVAVVASMQAVVNGEGHAAVTPGNSLIESLRKIGQAVLNRGL
jgi:carbonic anhydrase/acetyltransferase-like protein (isoleucine patch superfamily)